jgi:hypothetical protein
VFSTSRRHTEALGRASAGDTSAQHAPHLTLLSPWFEFIIMLLRWLYVLRAHDVRR